MPTSRQRDRDWGDEPDHGRGPQGMPFSFAVFAVLVALLVGAAAGGAGVYLTVGARAEREAERALAAEAHARQLEGRVMAGERDARRQVEAAAVAGRRGEPAGTAGAEQGEAAAELGGVKVRVAGAAAGRPAEGGKEAAGVTLILRVEVTPPAGGRVSYRGWGAGDAVTLRDQRGAAYRFRPRGERPDAPADPGKPVLDVLVFDRPADAAGTLELELPGAGVGVEGTFRVRIPKAVWDRPAPARD